MKALDFPTCCVTFKHWIRRQNDGKKILESCFKMLLIVNKVINGLTELLNETKEESNKKMNKVKIKEEGWTRA